MKSKHPMKFLKNFYPYVIISAFLLNPTLAMSWPGNGVAPATPDDKICQNPDSEVEILVRGDIDDSSRPLLNQIIAQGYPGGPINIGNNLDISDAIRLFEYLFLGGTRPQHIEVADVNNDGSVDLSDGIFLLNYLFSGGPSPYPPLIVTKTWDRSVNYFPFGTYLTAIENADNSSLVATDDGRQWRQFRVSYRRIGGPDDPDVQNHHLPFVIAILGQSSNIYYYGYHLTHTVCDPNDPNGTAHSFSFFLPNDGSVAIVGMLGDPATSTTAPPTILTFNGYEVLKASNRRPVTPDGKGGCVGCNNNGGGVEVRSLKPPPEICDYQISDEDLKKLIDRDLGQNNSNPPQYCPPPSSNIIDDIANALNSAGNAIPGVRVSFGGSAQGPYCGIGVDATGAAAAVGVAYEACECAFYACEDVASFLADKPKEGLDKIADAIKDTANAIADGVSNFFR